MTRKKKAAILAFILPVIYALWVRYAFGIKNWNELYGVMTFTFIFLLPLVMGTATIYLSSEEKVRKYRCIIFAPWIPVLIFFILTLVFAWEGWACWIMVLPIFLALSTAGGRLGAWLKKDNQNQSARISLLLLLPFLASPLEHIIGTIPGAYQADTYIDIAAPAGKIWKNVTRVGTIPASKDRSWLTGFLGFPRPVRAELDYEGVGASREAIFTNGLVFHETVTEYAHNEKMVFSIKAYPHEIPSATMDEHVVIGGDYFDVLNGTYRLEKLGEDRYRLHLSSTFKLSTHFNFYASWWAKWIMKDIQNNILQVEKERAEGG